MADRAVAGQKKLTKLANDTVRKAPHVGRHVVTRKESSTRAAHGRYASKVDKSFKKKRDFF